MGKLRLTNLSFLNDSMEYEYGINLFKNELVNFEIENGISNKLDLELIDAFSFKYSLFSISFCESGDDLNLWRGYCPSEGGLSIRFEKDKIFPKNEILINKCKYKSLRRHINNKYLQ